MQYAAKRDFDQIVCPIWIPSLFACLAVVYLSIASCVLTRACFERVCARACVSVFERVSVCTDFNLKSNALGSCSNIAL